MKIQFISKRENTIFNFKGKMFEIKIGLQTLDIKDEYLEEFKTILKMFEMNLIETITEAEVNKGEEPLDNLDEELIILKEEAKALGIKGVHLFKDKKPLIEKINEIKKLNEAEANAKLEEEKKQQQSQVNQ
jgi:hypothetical protein